MVRGCTLTTAPRAQVYQRGASHAQAPNTACAHPAQAFHTLAITRTAVDHHEFATAAPSFPCPGNSLPGPDYQST
jgi:hypothetical protein